MSKSRKERATENHRNNVRKIRQSAAEKVRPVGQNAVIGSQEDTPLGSGLLRRNAETVQTAMRVGLDAATAAMGGSTNQLGIAGSQVQQATELTTRGAATILHSS